MEYILDCTLRDGGYYNNWDFDSDVVENYLDAMVESKINYVEIGTRNFPKSGFHGAFAYTTESYLNSLSLPAGPTYGIMIDAKTILSSDLSVKDAIDALFVASEKSKIDLVRVAAHFIEVERSGEIIKHLKKLGYKVCFNLMQSGGKSCDVIADKARMAAEWGCLDVLYFADSFGNMDSNEVIRIIKALRRYWDGELGIHTHNNMGKGLDNTLTAREAGVTWLDTTVTGMGRGAGNTETESLLAVLDKENSSYNAKPVYEIVIKYFDQMQKNYGWGSSLLYFLGAQNDVHPTYIQNLLSNKHYGTDEIIGAIDYLSKLDGTNSYNGDVLHTALNFNISTKPASGNTHLVDKFINREVLIVSNGPGLDKYLDAITSYIKERTPVVIVINTLELLSSDLIDYYIVSHNNKYLSEYDLYTNLKKPMILPAHRFTDSELAGVCGVYYDYGLTVEIGEYLVNEKDCTIPFDLTIAYALAVAVIGKAKSIKLVGFDGYDSGDVRQSEMIKLFTMFKNSQPTFDIVALTPSKYPVKQGSIYAPNI